MPYFKLTVITVLACSFTLTSCSKPAQHTAAPQQSATPLTTTASSEFRPVAQTTPDPRAVIRDKADIILREPLETVHASQIQISLTDVLDQNVPFKPSPVFSSDGETVTYPQEQGNHVAIIVANLRTLSRVESWIPQSAPKSLAWSPDGKRLAYKTDKDLHIVEWATKNDIVVPLSEYFGSSDAPLAWVDPDKLVCVDSSRGYYFTLNLDTLKVKESEIKGSDEERRQLLDQLLGLSHGHPYSKIFQDQIDIQGSQNGPFLFVGEKDGTHQHVILNSYFAQYPFYVTPDLHHLLVYKDDTLTHHLLGLRQSPEMTFQIDLNNNELLKSERKTDFQRYLDQKVPFRGNVYAPLTNPLNGKLVGPDLKQLKGIVRVSKWTDTYAIVTNDVELLPMNAGDIVTDISSEQWPDFGNHHFEYKGEWRPLLGGIFYSVKLLKLCRAG